MSLKDIIHTGKNPKPRRSLFYGMPAIGKSTCAANAPNPVFIQTEEGIGDIDTSSLPFAQTLDKVKEQLMMLWEEEHDYKTVVIDSVTNLGRLIDKQVAKDKSVESIGDIGYGKAPEMTMRYWQEIIGAMTALWNSRNMGVILIAHVTTRKVRDPQHDEYQKFTPSVNELAGAALMEWCDEVFFMRQQTFTTADDGRVKATATDTRLIYCNRQPTYDAKNRLQMPDNIILDYKNYQTYIDKAQSSAKPTTKKESKQ